MPAPRPVSVKPTGPACAIAGARSASAAPRTGVHYPAAHVASVMLSGVFGLMVALRTSGTPAPPAQRPVRRSSGHFGTRRCVCKVNDFRIATRLSSDDSIHLPQKDAFKDAPGYYGTALHELAHWTGHPSRLNRPTLSESYRFGDLNYAKEELRAELASVFMAAELG